MKKTKFTVLIAVLIAVLTLAACEKTPAGAENSGGSSEILSTGQGGEGASAIWYALARRALGTGADSDEVQRQLSGAGADRQMVEQIMALLSNG